MGRASSEAGKAAGEAASDAYSAIPVADSLWTIPRSSSSLVSGLTTASLSDSSVKGIRTSM